jgi:DNA-entry nuclease
MEGRSVEDEQIVFCIYAFNAQPGIDIDYATGESSEAK